MDKKIEKLIRQAYPTGVYIERDESLLDRNVTDELVDKIVKRIHEIESCEINVEKIQDYDICFGLEIYIPNEKYIRECQRSKKKDIKRRYFTLIKISRLDRYYYMYWNSVAVHKGKFEALFLKDPPTKAFEIHERKVDKIFKNYRFKKLTGREVNEPVSWLSRKGSIVSGKKVKIYNCLFSEC